jgi:diaminopimelate epimerase
MEESSRTAAEPEQSARDEASYSDRLIRTAGLAANSNGEAGLLSFTKMQALGNDFVVVEEDELDSIVTSSKLFDGWQSGEQPLARALCSRNFGVGADGLIVVRKSDRADCHLGWRYINSDGSPARMCGNGLRCLALWAVRRNWVNPAEFKVSTEIGPVTVQFVDQDRITVDLGEPVLDSKRIPVSGPDRSPVLQEALDVCGLTLLVTSVSMGNPHCVIFDPAVPEKEFAALAEAIQKMPTFPDGVNVEFARVKSRRHVQVNVWERGCGRTLACATGAAATLVAGVLEGRLDRIVRIELPGGSLSVDWSEQDNHVRLTGPARESFYGKVDLAVLLTEGAQT